MFQQHFKSFLLKTYKEKILLIVFSGVVFFGCVVSVWWTAPTDFPINTIIEIPEGATLSQTAEFLSEKSIVSSVFWFKAEMFLLYGHGGVKAGNYVFDKPKTLLGVVEKLAKGRFGLTLTKITVPEGMTKSQIAKLLSAKFPLFDESTFLELATEGYLFPDTYSFFQDVKAKAVIGRMQEVFGFRTGPLRKEAELENKDFVNIVVIASLLEEEVQTKEDMKIVAGIIYKRLSIDMPLQIDSASSTYVYKGLPRAPISNPGLESLDAAMHPSETDFLYYLSDRSGKIYYAKDFDGHQTNRERYLGK